MKLNIQSIDWNRPESVLEAVDEWLDTSPSRAAMARVASVLIKPLIPCAQVHEICMTSVKEGVNYAICNATLHRAKELLYYLAKLGAAIVDPVGIGKDRGEEEWNQAAFEALSILSIYLSGKDAIAAMLEVGQEGRMTSEQSKVALPGSVVLMVKARVLGVADKDMYSEATRIESQRLIPEALTGTL